MTSDLVERTARKILERVPVGYGMTDGEAQDYARAAIAVVLGDAAKHIEEGFDRPGIVTKRDQCAHGRFGWEDCESCAATAIRKLGGGE